MSLEFLTEFIYEVVKLSLDVYDHHTRFLPVNNFNNLKLFMYFA